jgi:hypothetical protein
MSGHEQAFIVNGILACESGNRCQKYDTCRILDDGYTITVNVPPEEVTAAGKIAYLQEYMRAHEPQLDPCTDLGNPLNGGPVEIWVSGSFTLKAIG